MEFVRLQPARHPRLSGAAQDHSEGRYWRSFKDPVFLKSYAPISDVHFSPSSPHRFCVTSGTRLQIYSPKTSRVVKTISRFQLPARCGTFRHDGRLVVAGDDSGLVQVFDIDSRAILRTLKGHVQPVHVAKFSLPSSALSNPQDNNVEASTSASSVLTCSDDATVRLWDLATASPTAAFTSHDDYVRTGTFLPTSPFLVLSGSYDRTVRLWDSRTAPTESSSGCVWIAEHGFPVEDVVVHPSGTLAVSAGGPVVRMWDLLGVSGGEGGGSRCLRAMSNHQKTVTTLAFSGDRRRLLSAGLDGLVKVYDAEEGTWKVKHTMRYGGSLLSLALSPADDVLVAGAADGGLSVRKREVGKEERVRRQKGPDQARRGLAGAATRIMNANEAELAERRGDTSSEEEGEEVRHGGTVVVVRRRKKRRLQPWNRMLKAFRYADALDAVLRPTVPPNTTFSLINELMHRDGLDAAVAGRDDVTLAPLLRFLLRNVCDPRWSKTACDVLHAVLDIYSSVVGRSPIVDELLNRVRSRVESELQLERDLVQVQGQVELVMSATVAVGAAA